VYALVQDPKGKGIWSIALGCSDFAFWPNKFDEKNTKP
jgi:lambda repressor-like predicted transcriptional regulator